MGTAATDATVTVNDEAVHREGEWFRATITATNSAGPVETNLTVYAVWFDSGISSDLVSTVTGSITVPQATETLLYDNKASLTNDSRYITRFNALDRIEEIVDSSSGTSLTNAYTYYAGGQRATKVIYDGTTAIQTNTYIYDDWNLIHEEVHTTTGLTTRNYIYGLDLAGQRSGKLGQQAGGIGALSAIEEVSGGATNRYIPVADHNGNIHHLVDASAKQIVANYVYSPFGVLIGEWGDKVDSCPFRFQSKYYDKETGLYYYGYRHYNTSLGRWINRDPISERHTSRYAYVRNSPVSFLDLLGLEIVLPDPAPAPDPAPDPDPAPLPKPKPIVCVAADGTKHKENDEIHKWLPTGKPCVIGCHSGMWFSRLTWICTRDGLRGVWVLVRHRPKECFLTA